MENYLHAFLSCCAACRRFLNQLTERPWAPVRPHPAAVTQHPCPGWAGVREPCVHLVQGFEHLGILESSPRWCGVTDMSRGVAA